MNCDNRDIDHLVRCAATAGPSQFLHSDKQHLSLNTTGMSTIVSQGRKRDVTVGARLSPQRLHPTLAGPAQEIEQFVNELQLETALRHDRDVNDNATRTAHLTLHNNGHVKPGPRNAPSCTCRRNNGHVKPGPHLGQELQLRNSTGCTVWTMTPVLRNNGQDNLSINWTSPRRRPAQQGHRPLRRRTARNAARNAARPTKPPPPPRPPPPSHCLPPPAASWRRNRPHLRVHGPARRHSQ